jgi:hypothetical protein
MTEDKQHEQYVELQKLYADNGLELKMTCGFAPEQYEVFKDGKQSAYFRLRHGEFRVYCPDYDGELMFFAEPNGDGMFDDDERIEFMTNALNQLIK